MTLIEELELASITQTWNRKFAKLVWDNRGTIIAALKAAEWRPIEEAPKNGTPILVFIPFQWSSGEGASVWDVAHWDEHTAKWTTRTAPNYYQHCDPECQPTHFKPLGPGPEGEE